MSNKKNNPFSSLGDRMKGYEKAYNITFPQRLPVIIRCDGRAFHTLLRGLSPFDEHVKNAMYAASRALLEHIQGAKLVYTQSDEITVFVNNYTSLECQSWFGNKLQKMVSIAAAIASVEFSLKYGEKVQFDARAFVLPKEEVCNNFIWRQQDATRNSIQSTAHRFYAHKECVGKNCDDLQDMIFQKGVNWNDLPIWQKRGACMFKAEDGVVIDEAIPIFTQDRDYIDRWVFSNSD